MPASGEECQELRFVRSRHLDERGNLAGPPIQYTTLVPGWEWKTEARKLRSL